MSKPRARRLALLLRPYVRTRERVLPGVAR